MMPKILLLLITILATTARLSAQVLMKTSWQNAGASIDCSTSSTIVDVTNFGARGDSSTDCRTAINQAIASLAGNGGIIYFPAGKYRLTRGISLPDGVVLRGKSSRESSLIFDFGTSGDNGISINGSKDATQINIIGDVARGATKITLASKPTVKTGDYLLLTQDNPWETVPATSWAVRSPGQMVSVRSVLGNEVYLAEPLNLSFRASLNPRAQVARPRQFVGIENIRLRRMANAAGVPCNISFTLAANCWVKGIESHFSASSHIMAAQSAHLTIRGNYIHDGFIFDGSGTRGYGVTFIQQTTNCLVEDNIFRRNRHALICKEGANGNVMAYNYCRESFRTEFPSDGGADCLLHGFWPTANLYEGNIGQFFQASATWGPAGPHNTIFRNRFLNYGIFGSQVTNGTNLIQSDSTNIWANESTAIGTFMGFPLGVTVWQSNQFSQFANYAIGQLQPLGNVTIPEAQARSLYRSTQPEWWPSNLTWGTIGWPNQVSQSSIPAYNRWFDATVKTVPQVVSQTAASLSVNNWKDIGGRYKLLDIKNGGTVNFVAATTIDSLLIIRSGGTAIFNTSLITGNAKLVIESGANIVVNNTAGLWLGNTTGPLRLTGAQSVADNSNWIYNSTTAQFTGNMLPEQINHLVVNAGASLELSKSVQINNELLLASGQLIQNNQSRMTLAHTASIPQIGTGAGLTNGQFTTVNRRWPEELRTMRGSWVFISPIVSSQRISTWAQNNPFVSNTFRTTGSGSVYLYDPSATSGRQTNGYTKPDSANQLIGLGSGARVWVSPIKPASGYAVIGSPAIGDVTVPLKYCSQNCNFTNNNGWNFVGNPYLTSINWSKVTNRVNTANAVYSWDWRNRRWRTFINGIGTFGYDGMIGPAEGFMVLATGQSASLTFTEAAKSAGTAHLFNATETKPIYRLNFRSDSLTDEVALYQDAGATEAYDPALDAIANANPIATAITSDGYNTAIKAFGNELFLSIKLIKRSELTIDSLPLAAPGKAWMLIKQNGKAEQWVLGSGQQIDPVTLDAGTYRLEQRHPATLTNDLQVWPNPFNNQVTINLDQPIDHINVTDVTGRQYFSGELPSGAIIDTKHWPAGIYIIKNQTKSLRLVKQ